MPHLGLVSVCEGFFRKRPGPAEVDVGLLDHIACRLCGEGEDGRLARDVREDGPFRAVHFVPQIEAAQGGPGQLAMRDPSAGKAHHQQGIVLPLRFLAVGQRSSPGQDLDSRVVFAVEIASGRDAVAAEIMQRSPSGFLHVPEVRAVGSAVRLAGAHPGDAADAAPFDDLARLDHRGGENFRFRIAVKRARLARGLQHLLCFTPVARQGFCADLMLARPGQRERHRHVRLVWESDQIEVDIRAPDDGFQVGPVFRDVPLPGEISGPLLCSRVVDEYALSVHILQPLHVKFRHKPRSQHRNVDRFHLAHIFSPRRQRHEDSHRQRAWLIFVFFASLW